MNPITIILILLALGILGWAIWFVVEFVRYIATGEYETDKRLHDIRR